MGNPFFRNRYFSGDKRYLKAQMPQNGQSTHSQERIDDREDRLIVENNTIYEIDLECLRQKRQRHSS